MDESSIIGHAGLFSAKLSKFQYEPSEKVGKTISGIILIQTEATLLHTIVPPGGEDGHGICEDAFMTLGFQVM